MKIQFNKNVSPCRRLEIEELIKFASTTSVGLKHKGILVVVNVTNTCGGRGCAYQELPTNRYKLGKKIKQVCVIRIGKDSFFPERWVSKYKKVRDFTIWNWREMVVNLTAHELRHLWQFRNNRPSSETHCELNGIRAVEAYRRLNSS